MVNLALDFSKKSFYGLAQTEKGNVRLTLTLGHSVRLSPLSVTFLLKGNACWLKKCFICRFSKRPKYENTIKPKIAKSTLVQKGCNWRKNRLWRSKHCYEVENFLALIFITGHTKTLAESEVNKDWIFIYMFSRFLKWKGFKNREIFHCLSTPCICNQLVFELHVRFLICKPGFSVRKCPDQPSWNLPHQSTARTLLLQSALWPLTSVSPPLFWLGSAER